MLSPLQRRQILIFAMGWIAYASTYFLRKPLGVIKVDLETELHIPKTRLGWLDTALLLPYAIMQLLLSSLGDRFGPRKTFGVCLLLSGLSMVTFGLWSNFYAFFILLFLNGMSQAMCWPNVMKALGLWFSDNVRNTVFGMFGTCAFAGGIIGTTLAVYLQAQYTWRGAFAIPSAIVGGMGLIILLLFKTPAEVGIQVPGKETPPQPSTSTGITAPKISLWQICQIPMIIEVTIAVFCLKIVRYCMYMWLPMYLHNSLKYTTVQAGMFSVMFEVGGVAGSALIGLFIDRFFKKRTLLGTCACVLLSTISLAGFYITSTWGIVVNSFWLILAGAFNCGPDSILGGAIPGELGDMEGRNAAAATVGFVNGIGSMGTFLQGPIIGLVTTYWGWSELFYFLIGLALVGTLAVYRASTIYAKRQKLVDHPSPDV